MSEDTLLREFQLRLKLKNIKFEENDGKADRKAVPRADPFREFRRQLEQRDIGTEVCDILVKKFEIAMPRLSKCRTGRWVASISGVAF